jgi:hypothetical protein
MVSFDRYVNDEVNFNGGTLKIVTDHKEYTSHIDEAYARELRRKIASMTRETEEKRALQRELLAAIGKAKREKADDPSDHASLQTVRHGVFVKKPEKTMLTDGWDFWSEIDAEEGDEVWWDWYYTKEQKDAGRENIRVVEVGECKYLILPSQALFCAKRGEQLIPLNGNYIGRKLDNELKVGAIHLPDTGYSRVEIVAVPKSKPKYVSPLWSETDLEVGNVVYMKNQFCVPLDSSLNSGNDLVRFQSRIITAVE